MVREYIDDRNSAKLAAQEKEKLGIVEVDPAKVWVKKTEKVELFSQQLHITHLDGRRFSTSIFESLVDTTDPNGRKIRVWYYQTRLSAIRASINCAMAYGNFHTFYPGDAPTEKSMKDIDTIVYEEPTVYAHDELITWEEVK
jgi:hypothetical protein